MDSPELTQRFVYLTSKNNRLLGTYYKYRIMPLVLRYIKPEMNIIDVGCGAGMMLELLYEKGFRNLCGIDAKQELLDQISIKEIPTKCANYLCINQYYEKGSFDAAMIFNTLHHLDNKEDYYTFYSNLCYILKPGAIVIMKEIYNGLVYHIYNRIIFNPISKWIFSEEFSKRQFVQSTEREMHARFFKHFLPNIEEIIFQSKNFMLLKEYRPLYFERMFVMMRS